MEQDRRLELIDHAIQKLIHDNNKGSLSNSNSISDAQYQHALSHLLSLSQLKGEELEGSEEKESENDEIMKELKKVKRQNVVTHCLLSVMIVLTLAWQLSEVSIMLKVKDGLSHPFRSFGKMLKGMVKAPDLNLNAQQNDDHHESPSIISDSHVFTH
ncbi:hypothetical protein VNO78_28500 [Psophocarpus tetragonolobus]|uniref:Uncharacterized protein n=1 Tax=Psophocarpus tetragonolobus TaxID=3891 RepID=A0AAN9S1J3_PSOTE